MISSNYINFSIEKTQFSKNIRRSFRLRISFLKSITFFLVIYLITLPVFDYLNQVLNHPRITFREEYVIYFILLITSVLSIYWIITVSQAKFTLNKYLFLFIIVLLFISELNPFWLTFKFSAALIFYEIPIIVKYYDKIFQGYQSYSPQQITEFSQLQILFDRHFGHIITLNAVMIGTSWILIVLADRIRIDLGNQAGVTIPIILIVVIVILVYFRSDISNTLYKQQSKKEKRLLD